MTTLSEFREAYYEASGTASTIARQLGFAGIAIIWVFKQGDGGNFSVPKELFEPGLVIVLCLLFDLLQYVSKSVVWGVFAREKETAGVKDEDEIIAPMWLNWPALFFFWGKIVMILYAYVLLGKFLLLKVT